MFFSFFSSKNQKLVKQWSKEHKQIVKIATNIITAYSNNKLTTAKKELKELRMVTLNHLMTEDIEFSRMEKDTKNLDKDTATAAAEELAGKQPSEDLLKDIKSLERQIQDLDKFIVDKHLEQEMIEKAYRGMLKYNLDLNSILHKVYLHNLLSH